MKEAKQRIAEVREYLARPECAELRAYLGRVLGIMEGKAAGPLCVACVGDCTNPDGGPCLRCGGSGVDPDPAAPAGIGGVA